MKFQVVLRKRDFWYQFFPQEEWDIWADPFVMTLEKSCRSIQVSFRDLSSSLKPQ